MQFCASVMLLLLLIERWQLISPLSACKRHLFSLKSLDNTFVQSLFPWLRKCWRSSWSPRRSEPFKSWKSQNPTKTQKMRSPWKVSELFVPSRDFVAGHDLVARILVKVRGVWRALHLQQISNIKWDLIILENFRRSRPLVWWVVRGCDCPDPPSRNPARQDIENNFAIWKCTVNISLKCGTGLRDKILRRIVPCGNQTAPCKWGRVLNLNSGPLDVGAVYVMAPSLHKQSLNNFIFGINNFNSTESSRQTIYTK